VSTAITKVVRTLSAQAERQKEEREVARAVRAHRASIGTRAPSMLSPSPGPRRLVPIDTRARRCASATRVKCFPSPLPLSHRERGREQHDAHRGVRLRACESRSGP
jgi:hypothetical protein